MASAISVMPAAFAIAICSWRLIESQLLPERSTASKSISFLSAAEAFIISYEFNKSPPKIAFNFPAAEAAPSKVSNCSAKPMSVLIDTPSFLDAAATFLNIFGASLPNVDR